MENRKLNDTELDNVNGGLGMANPVAGLSEEEANPVKGCCTFIPRSYDAEEHGGNQQQA